MRIYTRIRQCNTLTAEKSTHSVLLGLERNFVQACIIMDEIVYLFVNGAEINKFRAKDSEIVTYPLYLGNISKNISVDNMKKTGLNGYVYDFSVDYEAIVVDDILEYTSI